jgi:AraC-like DNA-binding protein
LQEPSHARCVVARQDAASLQRAALPGNPRRARAIHFAPRSRYDPQPEARRMIRQPLPRGLKKALERLESEPARAWRLEELAAAAGLAPRTLQKHFRRFLGSAPRAFLRELRLTRARQELLHGPSLTSVTEIATANGFAHLGRFAIDYQRRYGESPSATLRRSQRAAAPVRAPLPVLSAALDRPAVAVSPFDIAGAPAELAISFADEIALALWRIHALRIAAPSHAAYHLLGMIRAGARGALRVTTRLIEATTGRYLWAARWEGDAGDLIGFEERVACAVARAVHPTLCAAEIDRASGRDRGSLGAWGLTMRALPHLMTVEAAAEGMALELLEEAMAIAPNDPLPIAAAAWCHGLRAGHHFSRKVSERAKARDLAARAASLNSGDALAETMLTGGYTLAHDLEAAAVHAERALAIDGGSAWAWGRSAWIKAYRGRAVEAMEEFEIARSLAPADPLSFLWSIGIASEKFQMGQYDQSISWYRRARAENPKATWSDRFLAPAYVLAGHMDEGRRTLARFTVAFPGLTIGDVRSGLPWNAAFLDRTSEGLESAGMHP